MNNQHAARTKFMVELALMVAIIFVMAFTPLGYFQTMGLSITFLTVPVAVGAIILGPKGGAICGLAFGITSLCSVLNGCIWNDAVFHQPAGNCICVYRTKTSGRTALWSDFSGIEKIYEKRSLSGGKSFLPASEYSVFYDQFGSSIL